jgi:hypothetical protein
VSSREVYDTAVVLKGFLAIGGLAMAIGVYFLLIDFAARLVTRTLIALFWFICASLRFVLTGRWPD